MFPTVLFQGLRGRRDRLVWPEQPTTAKYSWRGRDRRAGNADYFLAPATAIELNHGYTDHDKIKQDFIKLLDPQNGYHEAIYFVYGKPRFRAAVQAGLTKALQFLAASQAVVIAGCPLHVLVVKTQRQRSRLWEATMAAPFLPDTLLWTEVFLTTVEERSHANGLANQGTTTRQELHIAREEATSTHDAKMIAAGIPLRSTTARCMFRATQDSRGSNNCKFGPTPLWDNTLQATGGNVLRSDFLDLAALVASGQTFQQARWAKLRRVAGVA
jgi:hypothetical protein